MPSDDQQLTPKRRRINQEQATVPASPAARALSGLRSWLSPWRGSATRSAAFGSNDEQQHDQDQSNDSSLADQSLYPALPSSTSNPMLTDDHPHTATPSGPASAAFPFTFTPPAAEQQHSPTVNNPFSQRTPNAAAQTSPSQPILPYPRSHNFDILSRFFAEKAAAENGGQLDPESSTLTTEEIRGCIDLIQQSGAHPAELQQAVLDQADYNRANSSYEAPARRRNTVRRSWLSPAPSHASRHDYNDTHSDISRSARTHTDMSFSPERDFPIPYSATSPPPPSRSYLAPLGRSTMTYSSTEPASIFARSLTGRPSNGASAHANTAPNPFLTGSTSVAGSLVSSTSSAASRRRRRPLYLGPGLSSSSAAALRRRQAAAQSTRPAQQDQTSAVGLGKRQRVEGQEDPARHDFAMALDAPSPASSTVSHSSDSRSIASLPRTTSTSKGNSISLPAQPAPAKLPPAPAPATQRQTRAANAARSILAEVDLPKPAPSRKLQKPKSTEQPASSAKSSLSTLSEDPAAFSDTSFRPDTILNPYQSSPGLNFGKSANGSTSSSRKSRSSEAFEKMKNERQKSTRMRRDRSREDDGDQNTDNDEGPGDTSLLEQIERHRPSSMRHSKAASSRASSMASKSPEPPSTPSAKSSIPLSTTPTSAPPQAAVAAKESEKTLEARRRLEAMKKDSKPPPAAPSSSSTASSSSIQAPATPAAASTKPFSFASSPFTHAHAPGKPSRLSIAFNANESPSSTASSVGEDEEEDERSAKATSPPKETVFTSGATNQFSFAPAPAPKSTPQPFSFGKPASDNTNAQATPPIKSLDFGGSQAAKAAAPAPFSFQPPAATSNSAKAAISTPSLSFNPAPVPSLKKGSNESAPSAEDVQAEALKKSPSELPLFDLGTDAVAKISEDGVHVVEAIKIGAGQLPRYDVVNGQTGAAAASNAAASSTSISTPSFSFNAQSKPFTPSAAPPSAVQSAPSPSAAPAAPAAAEPAEENTDGSSSSLFEGGQGEEGEETAFEVRAKIRKFVGGKWEDLGIGIARVKTRTDDDGTAIRRLLVRNSGNGAVTVNFRLFKDFKATQKGKQVSFTGFDVEGKGSPMSCQVKTEDSAKEFKDALEAAS